MFGSTTILSCIVATSGRVDPLEDRLGLDETIRSEEREIAGISDGLVWISVRLEDPEDIIRDLDQALEAARKVAP
ncbi:MAG: hypothetical protein GY719_13055 [bacterium]|nr:hypothetical protein [bacterium]